MGLINYQCQMKKLDTGMQRGKVDLEPLPGIVDAPAIFLQLDIVIQMMHISSYVRVFIQEGNRIGLMIKPNY